DAHNVLAHLRLAIDNDHLLTVIAGLPAQKDALAKLRHLDAFAVEPRRAYRGRLERNSRERIVTALCLVERGLVFRFRVFRLLRRLAALHVIEHLLLGLL